MLIWIVGPQMVGLMFIILGLLQKLFPPKKPNGFYGYRMPSVSASQPKWQEAQRYSAIIMMKLGLIYIIIGLLIAAVLYQFNVVHTNAPVILTIFAGISAPVLLIVFTEKHLNKVFKE